MNANSAGSVTPQMKEQIAAEATRPIAAFFLAGFTFYHCQSCNWIPNIIQEEAGHIHSSSRIHQRLSHLPRSASGSPSPMVSNQNTLFSA